MAFEIGCRELELAEDCDFVARGQELEEIINAAVEHGKEAHGLREEQVRDPKVVETVKAKAKFIYP